MERTRRRRDCKSASRTKVQFLAEESLTFACKIPSLFLQDLAWFAVRRILALSKGKQTKCSRMVSTNSSSLYIWLNVYNWIMSQGFDLNRMENSPIPMWFHTFVHPNSGILLRKSLQAFSEIARRVIERFVAEKALEAKSGSFPFSSKGFEQ